MVDSCAPVHVVLGGSGAVGAVYANYLKEAKQNVVLYVREEYERQFERQKAEQGFTSIKLYHLQSRVVDFVKIQLKSLLLAAVVGLYLFKSYAFLYVQLPILLALFLVFRWFQRVPLARTSLFRDFEVCSTPAQLRKLKRVDFLWLCINSAQLHENEARWLKAILAELSPTTYVVCMTPGMFDDALLTRVWPSSQCVFGTVPLLSYQAPLQHERGSATHTSQQLTQLSQTTTPTPGLKHGDGIAFFIASPSQFYGAPSATAELVSILCGSGLKSVVSASPPRVLLLGATNVLHSFLIYLELSQWKFSQLANNAQRLKLCRQVMKDSIAVSYAHFNLSIPLAFHFLPLVFSPLVFSVITFVLGELPIDIETQLAYHFSKVGQQTIEHMEEIKQLFKQHPQYNNKQTGIEIEQCLKQIQALRKLSK